MCKSDIVICSGYFNPLHDGHCSMIEDAARLGNKLLVIVNNDKQVQLKGSVPFFTETQRIKIIQSLKFVDEAILAVDNDPSINQTLALIRNQYKDASILFINGGDVNSGNCRELEVCARLGINSLFGVGGFQKKNNSSKIIQNAANWLEKMGKTGL